MLCFHAAVVPLYSHRTFKSLLDHAKTNHLPNLITAEQSLRAARLKRNLFLNVIIYTLNVIIISVVITNTVSNVVIIVRRD